MGRSSELAKTFLTDRRKPDNGSRRPASQEPETNSGTGNAVWDSSRISKVYFCRHRSALSSSCSHVRDRADYFSLDQDGDSSCNDKAALNRPINSESGFTRLASHPVTLRRSLCTGCCKGFVLCDSHAGEFAAVGSFKCDELSGFVGHRDALWDAQFFCS